MSMEEDLDVGVDADASAYVDVDDDEVLVAKREHLLRVIVVVDWM